MTKYEKYIIKTLDGCSFACGQVGFLLARAGVNIYVELTAHGCPETTGFDISLAELNKAFATDDEEVMADIIRSKAHKVVSNLIEKWAAN